MKSAAKKPDSSQSSSPFRSKGTNKGFFSVQARLKVNTPGDAHEVEADRAAEKVVSNRRPIVLPRSTFLPLLYRQKLMKVLGNPKAMK